MNIWFRPTRHSATLEDATTPYLTSGIPVLDPRGDAFEVLRANATSLAMYRLSAAHELPEAGVMLLAAYENADLERAAALIQTRPIVVVGIGLGERVGSVARRLGAVAYVHDGLDQASLMARLAETLRRQSYPQERAEAELVA